MDFELVQSVAPHFRVKRKTVLEFTQFFRSTVSQWRKLAERLDISSREQNLMANANLLI